LGRSKTPINKRKLRGNPGKRDLPVETEVDSAPMRCPIGLSKPEKKYWHIWAPSLIAAGKLTILTVPSLVTLIQMKVRLDEVNRFIRENNNSLLQESIFIDGSGAQHSTFRESAYSKLSRDLTTAVHRLQKSWGLTADSAIGVFKPRPKKSAEEQFLE